MKPQWRDAPCVPPSLRVTLRELRDLGVSTGYRATSQRWWYLPYAVVDDHPIMRNGLRDTLEASDRFEVVGVAVDGEEAVNAVEELRPDVIVMDVIMPNKDSIDACREIMELLPDTGVLMMTASTEMDAEVEAVAAGVTGYLQKYSPSEELAEAVLDVAQGRVRMSEQALKEVFAMTRSGQWLPPVRHRTS